MFDSAGRVNAGKFTFRFWLNDVTPPVGEAARLLQRRRSGSRSATAARASTRARSSRASTATANVDGSYAKGVLSIRTGSLSGGKHTIEVDVSDYQEAKNMEDVLRILPNTRVFKTAFTVR